MGNINTLFTTNPSEILPVEAYLSDLSCEATENLGSTRFMKVARGRTSEGVFVYKVYVRQDNTSIDPYPSTIINIRNALSRAPNCCPIRKVLVKPKYAVILRIYQKHTLFDRISTRPFVVYPEKVWYIYQLFKALAQCETVGVCHGDLKSQNVLISSSNWLQITDFAPFKPSFLPQDNPSSFAFFFDTSRRQSCYIAPERLIASTEYNTKFTQEKDSWLFGSLKPSMDIFSAGCIVYELLCDGRAPFTYSQLCEYRAMSNSDAAAVLSRLVHDVPPQFQPLLKLLLNREPEFRLSANAVLTGAAFSFPPLLESFLFRYLDMFRPLYGSNVNSDDLSQPLEFSYLEPDDVIVKLKKEKDIWWSKIAESEETKPFAVLFVSLITANIRALRTIQTKTDAVGMLVELSTLCESSIAIDRILPYFVHFMNDPETQVRSTAIRSSADLLEPIRPKTYEESLVFVDYLFPEISMLMTDYCPQQVLFTIATSLGTLAMTAYKYLIASREIRAETYDDEISTADNLLAVDTQQQQSDDSTALRNGVATIFSSLCSGNPMVKRCLVEPESLSKIYEFFTKTGNGEEVLKSLITFLNLKAEWRLRAAFYDSLPICVQKGSIGMLPLIQQGLQDFEENVIVRALGSVNILIRNDHLHKWSIMELLADIVPFLAHPNEWIRSVVCDILITLDQKWHMAEIYVKIIPMVSPFFEESKRKMLTLKSKIVLMNSLLDPIPRRVFAQIMELNLENTKQLVGLLEIHFEKGIPFEASAAWFKTIFPKIDKNQENPDVTIELNNRKRLIDSLFAFRKMLLQMADTRNTAGMEKYLTQQLGLLDLSSNLHNRVRLKKFVYGSNEAETSKLSINWAGLNRHDTLLADGEVVFEEERSTASGTQNLRSSIFEHQVSSIMTHLNELHMKNVASRRSAKIGSTASITSGSSRQTVGLKGNIITHLHEHSSNIRKLAAKREMDAFASCSHDGSVKIWKTKNVLGEGYGAARSELTWIPSEGTREVVENVGWCDRFISAATRDGFIRWADVANGGAKLATEVTVPLAEGAPICVHTSGPLNIVRTHHGILYGIDLRVGATNGPLGKHDVWRKKLRDDHGLITCSAVDPWQQSWMVLGTNSNSKNLMLYDLRFREEVLRWESPHKDIRPQGIWANPVSRIDGPEVYVGFTMHGEVSSFELSVQPARKRVLWTGGTPILSYDAEPKQGELAALQTKALCVCESTGLVYTGDTRGAIRKWNTMKATGCEVLSAPLKGRTQFRTIFEETSSVAEPFVIYERKIVNTDARENRRIVALDSKPSTYHRTQITDMLLLGPDLMISSSYDGIIKVWK